MTDLFAPKNRRADYNHDEWSSEEVSFGITHRLRFAPPGSQLVFRPGTEELSRLESPSISWGEVFRMLERTEVLTRLSSDLATEPTFTKNAVGIPEGINPSKAWKDEMKLVTACAITACKELNVTDHDRLATYISRQFEGFAVLSGLQTFLRGSGRNPDTRNAAIELGEKLAVYCIAQDFLRRGGVEQTAGVMNILKSSRHLGEPSSDSQAPLPGGETFVRQMDRRLYEFTILFHELLSAYRFAFVKPDSAES